MENKFPSKFPEASRIVIEGLLELARQRPEMGRALQELHVWFGRELATTLGPVCPPSSADSSTALSEKVVSIGDERRIVRIVPSATDDGRRERERRGVDLERVAERSTCKADAYARAAQSPAGPERARAAAELLASFSEEVPAGLHAVLAGRDQLPSGRGLDVIAACYSNVSQSAEVVLRLRQSGRLDGVPPTALLYLLAEAQSSLLNVLAGAEVYSDSDQHDLFLWLKDQTTRHRIYVDRHMRLDDPADCTGHADLALRLRSFEESFDRKRRAEDDQKRLLSKFRFHGRKVCDSQDFEGHDWGALLEVAAEWRRAGHAATEAAAALAPLRKLLPDDLELPEDLEHLLRIGQAANEQATRIDLVARASELLAGRTVALLGRRERPPSKLALQEQFRLAELRWVELEDESVEQQLEREIARPEINMVLIAMRLPGPLYEEFKELCIRHHKPFVRLPNGYAPGQVAQQVLRQVGRRLKPLEPELSGG